MLTDRQASAVMRWMDGQTLERMASGWGVTKQTAAYHVHAGLGRIKAAFSAEWDDLTARHGKETP